MITQSVEIKPSLQSWIEYFLDTLSSLRVSPTFGQPRWRVVKFSLAFFTVLLMDAAAPDFSGGDDSTGGGAGGQAGSSRATADLHHNDDVLHGGPWRLLLPTGAFFCSPAVSSLSSSFDERADGATKAQSERLCIFVAVVVEESSFLVIDLRVSVSNCWTRSLFGGCKFGRD